MLAAEGGQHHDDERSEERQSGDDCAVDPGGGMCGHEASFSSYAGSNKGPVSRRNSGRCRKGRRPGGRCSGGRKRKMSMPLASVVRWLLLGD
jgi:hypothetical protein